MIRRRRRDAAAAGEEAIVLRWSPSALKLTLGIGGLGLTVMLSHWRDTLTVPVVVILAFAPFATFLMVSPGEQSDRAVRIAQVAASCWYLGLTAVLLIVWRPPFANQTFSYAFVLIGAIPCALALMWAARGRPSDDPLSPRPPRLAGERSADDVAEAMAPPPSDEVSRGPRAYPLAVPRVLLMLLGCAGFVALGVWLVLSGRSWIGLVTLYFLVPIVPCLRRLADEAPALEVTHEGIVDRTPLLGVGLIRWEEMSGIALGKMGVTHHLTLDVRDPEAVLSRTGPIERFQAKLSSWMGYSPVMIHLFPVDGDAREIWATIERESPRSMGVGA